MILLQQRVIIVHIVGCRQKIVAAFETGSPAVPGWEHFEHIADVGVRGYGHTLGQAFEMAALAMLSVITDTSTVRARETVRITCEAPNSEFLLADWLNAIVFEMATRKLLVSRFEVTIEDNHLEGVATGEPIDVTRHQPAAEVKGATLSELRVSRSTDNYWLAQCIVDV